MRATTLGWLALIALGVALDKHVIEVPRAWNPFAPLAVDDPVTPVTRLKLARVERDPEACRAALRTAPEVRFTPLADYTPVQGCPLTDVVRLQSTGVRFSSSLVATCPLALAWTMFERHELQPLAERTFGSRVNAVRHFGSFACRNIYHRENARRSEHATASALDVASFTLASGERIDLLEDWDGEGRRAAFLREVQAGACGYFGTVIGPDYNAAHANHFHLGMRGVAFCR